MTQQINLLRTSSHKARFSFTSPRAMAYGLSIAVALSVLVAVYENHRLGAVEAEARNIAAMLKDATLANDKAIEGNVPRKPNAELEIRVRDLEAQLKARQEIVDALRRGLVGTTSGFSEYMRVFSRQTLQGVWLTGFDITAGGDELTIAGRALSADLVPAYLQRLNREAAIQGRQFGSMVINQAPEAPKLEQHAADSKQQVVRAVPAAPYLDFTLASNDPGHGLGRVGASAQRIAPSAVLLGGPVPEAADEVRRPK
jgi:hypothetical protein